jgi:uncharacterized delta-60 repeat protein
VIAWSRGVAALCVLWGLIGVSAAGAASGDLDPTFNDDGTLTTNFPRGSEAATDLAVGPDGKIVVVGGAFRNFRWYFGVARFNPDGTLDRSFDGDGKTVTGFTSGSAWPYGVKIQPDGKIVVAGKARGSFALVRYLPNGRLDTSFGGDGKVRTNLTSRDDAAYDLVIQANGRIVAGGAANRGRPFPSDSSFALVGYRRNGTLDPTFSRNGRVVTDFSSFLGDSASSLALQADGKIVAGGQVGGAHRSQAFAVGRYNPHGTLDTGWATDILDDYNEGIADVALQPDGKILAGGWAGDEGGVVVRHAPDGMLDPTFDSDGIVWVEPGSWAPVTGLAVQDDQRIVIAAPLFQAFPTPFYLFELIRLNPDGALDTTFGGDGAVTTDFPVGKDQRIWAVALQPDGKILAAGTVSFDADARFGVARYLVE